MKKLMNFYFDTEFTGLYQNTLLLSIGIVSESGKKFYGEILENVLKNSNEWVGDNVIPNMIANGCIDTIKNIISIPDVEIAICKDKSELRTRLYEWLEEQVYIPPNEGDQYEKDNKGSHAIAQFVSDVCHYDFVLLCDVFEGALRLPDFISPFCHDINTDIANAGIEGISNEYEAFDANREALLEMLTEREEGAIDSSMKHNALHDACVIELLYNELKNRM